MFEAENNHWWYVGNHENFLQLLKNKNILKNGISVLDAGCGTGKWLEILKKSCDISETGVDFQEIAIEYAKTRGAMNLIQGDLNNCMFPVSSFDLITCFDVVCHSSVNDNLVISKFNSFLKNQGYLLITLPAFSFLYSKHDVVVQTKKRYSKRQVKLLLEENGFEIVKMSYSVSLLFPIALVKRIVDKFFIEDKKEHNEVKIPSPAINKIFLSIMRIENALLKYISFPFGLSVMVLAQKKHLNQK